MDSSFQQIHEYKSTSHRQYFSIVESASPDTEITNVSCSSEGDKCKINWHTVSGGVLICVSAGFCPWPKIELLDNLSDWQLEKLKNEETLETVLKDGSPCHLIYQNSAKVLAKGGTYSFSTTREFTPPIRIQLWAVSEDAAIVMKPSAEQNMTILKTQAVVTKVKKCPLFPKYVITIDLRNAGRAPDGVMSYTVSNSMDVNGELIEYPIPRLKIGTPFKLRYKPKKFGEITVRVSERWKDVIDVTGG